MRGTIKELEHRYQDAERKVSLFYGYFFHCICGSLSSLNILRVFGKISTS